MSVPKIHPRNVSTPTFNSPAGSKPQTYGTPSNPGGLQHLQQSAGKAMTSAGRVATPPNFPGGFYLPQLGHGPTLFSQTPQPGMPPQQPPPQQHMPQLFQQQPPPQQFHQQFPPQQLMQPPQPPPPQPFVQPQQHQFFPPQQQQQFFQSQPQFPPQFPPQQQLPPQFQPPPQLFQQQQLPPQQYQRPFMQPPQQQTVQQQQPLTRPVLQQPPSRPNIGNTPIAATPQQSQLATINAPPSDGTAVEADSGLFRQEKQALKNSLAGMRPSASKDKKRINNSYEVLDSHLKGANNYVYRLQGKPVGLMSLSKKLSTGSMFIHGVVTSPDTKGVGGALIEKAVNLSMSNGGGGRVSLEYMPGTGVHLAYEKLGFRLTGGLVMELDPSSRPELWTNEGGQWKLKKPPPSIVGR